MCSITNKKQTFTHALKKVNMEKMSRELLKAMSDSSQQMLGNLSKNVVINEVLAILGNVAKVDRTYVFQNTYEKGKLVSFSYAYEWCARGIEPQINNEELHNIPWTNFEELLHILKSKESFSVNTIDLGDDPTFQQALEMQSIKSVLFMPIFTDQEFWGYIGFDDCREEREWSEEELLTLSSIAANLGAFIERKRMHKQIEEQHARMEQQKTFYERLINRIPADIVVIGTDHRYKFISEHAITNPEIRNWIIDKNDHEYAAYRNKPKELADKRLAQQVQAIQTAQSVSHEESFLMPDGKIKHHIRILHPVLNTDQSIDYLLGYGIDITDLKERDAIILKQHKVIEETPIAVAFLNKEGNYYYMNQSHESIFGYGAGELIGKPWQTLYLPDEIEKIQQYYFPKLYETGKWKGETKGVKKDGSPIWQEITLSSLDDGSIVCISQDVTRAREDLKTVQLMHEQLELAMDASELAMFTWDLEKDIIKFSSSIKRIIPNWDTEQLELGMPEFLSLVHKDDVSAVNELLTTIRLRTEKESSLAFAIEYRIILDDERSIAIFGKGKISRFNESGKPIEFNGFMLDISKQRELDMMVKASEKRYRDLVESIKEVMFKVDLNNRWKFVNKAWTDISGYTQEETVGKRMTDFILPKDNQRYLRWYRSLAQNPNSKIIDEIRFLDKKGNILLIEFSASTHFNNEENVYEIVGIAQNTTQIKAIEAELEQSKQLLEQIISSIDEVIWSFDISTEKISYISPSCEQLTQKKDTEFYTNPSAWYDLLETEYLDGLVTSDDELQNGTKDSRDIIYPIRLKDGSVKWVRDQAKVIFNEYAEPIRIDGVSTNITNLIEAEHKLKVSEEKYRLISESIQDIITVLDVEGNVQYISPSSVKVTGYAYENLIDNNFLKVVHEDDRRKVYRFLRNTVNRKDSDAIVFRFLKANGDIIWMETVASVFQENTDGTILIQASSRDVTIRKQAEIELTRALQKEKELGELKSRFVSMASHEFRTPLSTIRIGAELIKMFIDNDKQKLSTRTELKVADKVNDILIDVDRITDLMTDILTMGKVEASRVPFNPEPVIIDDFMADYLSAEAPRVFHVRKWNFTNESKQLQVNIDKKLIKQVLQNVLSNAVKYSPVETAVDIKLTTESDKILISVTDYGMGIPEKDLPFVFESFFRASNAENIPGTGLGMPIIKLFTEMHGGRVSISSEQRKGTTLTIALPLAIHKTILPN